MSVSSKIRIGVGVFPDHTPSGMLEGVVGAANLIDNAEGIPLTPELLLQILDGSIHFDHLHFHWSDTHAGIIPKIIAKAPALGTTVSSSNSGMAQVTCSTFNTPGQFLYFGEGLITGRKRLGDKPADDFLIPEGTFAPWRRDGIVPILLVPTDAAAIYAGFISAQNWLDRTTRVHGFIEGEYLASYHPKADRDPQKINGPHYLAKRALHKVAWPNVRSIASYVISLQSGGIIEALKLGIEVRGDAFGINHEPSFFTEHPVGVYMRDFNLKWDEIDRADLLSRIAATEIPATSEVFAHKMAEVMIQGRQEFIA